MRVDVAIPPTVEPVTLAEAKGHLRVDLDFDDDDDLIGRNIKTARAKVESILRQPIIMTTFDAYFDGWPNANDGLHVPRQIVAATVRDRVLDLPRCPVAAVAGVYYLDQDDAEQTLDPSTYRVLTGKPGRIQLRRGATWPTSPIQLDSIRVRFTAGHATTAETAPTCAKDAMLLVLGNLYANRGDEESNLTAVLRDILSPLMFARRP